MALKITGKLTDPRTPFRSVPSALPLGTALADVSMGWDGTVWGIDERGVPYRLDPLAETWQLLGRGYDALTYDEDGRFLVIRDGLVFEASGTAPPQPLTRRWPNAATSFQHALDGAGRAAGEVFLFGSGRYAVASDDHAANPPRPLASLAGWPSGPDWSIFADGVIDAVGSNEADAEDPHLLLFRRGWYVAADMAKRQVVGGPWPVSDLFESLPTPTPMPPPLEAGFDAVLYLKQNRTDIKSFTGLELYQGLVVWGVGHRGATTAYADFYEGWSPTLAEAPSGRAADLWSTAKDGTPRHHDGSDWSGGPSHDGGALRSISVGADGAVFAVGGDDALLRLSPDGTAWTRLAAVPADAAQVAAGDAGRVWVRRQQGDVLQYGAAGGSLTPVPLGAPATHIAGNHDGTLWHCREGGAAVHRFISEGEAIDTEQRSQALSVARDVTSVTRVASLGFGTAYVLAAGRSTTGLGEGTAQLYAYDSPYVFKTSASYNAFVQNKYGANVAAGGGQLYVLTYEGDSQYVVALDAQSGDERWRTPAPMPTRVVYDPNYQFVYVAGFDAPHLYALDARTGASAWATADWEVSSMSMSVAGNALCVADFEAKLWVFDTALARRDGPAGRHPIPIWAVELWQEPRDTFAWVPLIEERTAYVAAFVQPGEKDTGIRTLVMACVDLAPGTVRWSRHVDNIDFGAWDGSSLNVLRANIAFSAAPEPALVLNASDRIVAFRLADDGATQKSYPAPGNVRFTTDITASDGLLYVGSKDGSLYTLDAGLRLVQGGPMQLSPGRQVLASPVVGRDEAGVATVVTSTEGDDCLWLAQPSTRNLVALSTNLTYTTDSAFDATQGVLYTAGQTTDRSLGQVFAIRVSEAVQDLRDFIVESELLQDYEQQPSSSSGAAPPAPVARYQTHVTVVNDVKAPQPHQSLKLWADRPTDVRIDGTPYTLGPTAPATLQTDGSGSLTIVSDAADMFATPLRLWAAFMDPYERVVIYPDREFHGRLSTTNASGAGDPRTIDLASATPYADATKPLFDADQAHAVAGAVQQALKGVGMGATVPPAGAGDPARDALAGASVAGRHAAAHVARADAPGRYVALPDLTGLSYFPADTPSTRTAVIATPIGMALTSDGSFTAMPAAKAAEAIDGLGAGLGASVGGVFDDFKQLWASVKAGEAKVARVVISVANDVYLGIEYKLIDGVSRVFNQVVRDVEDVAAAIGSFFVMLGKKLAEVLEALSQLLHLEQVFATADLIREIFDACFDSTNPNGLHAILTRAKEGSEAFFPTALGKVDDYLKQVASTLDPGTEASTSGGRVSAGSTGIGRLRGMGATPHTVLAAAPKHGDSGQPPSSLAVQGMWGIHQARQHAEAAAPANQLASADNPLADLVENFIRDQRLSDPSTPLGKVLADARRQFATSFTVQSPDEFFRLALSDLLALVRIMVTGTLELVQKFIDTLLESIDAIVDGLRNVGELSIPILSPLWEAKFGKPLTFLDLLAFVVAIPVTLLYRIIEGRYPGEDRLLEGTDGPRLVLNRVAGLTSAAAGIAAGVFTAYVDTARILSGGIIVGPLTVPQKITSKVLMGTELTLTFYEGTTSPSAALASTATFMTIAVDEAAEMPEIAARFNSVLNLWLMVMFVYAFIDAANEQDWKEFTSNELKAIPGLVGPTKFWPRPASYVAPGADLTGFLAAAGFTIASTVERWDGEHSRPGRRQ
jgi:outer membrane protein assembly factor BamB